MTRIIVSQRTDDWHACFEGYGGVWESGISAEDAIRRLAWLSERRDFAVVLNPPYCTDGVVRPFDFDKTGGLPRLTAQADQGIQVTQQALADLGPVLASIEAAEPPVTRIPVPACYECGCFETNDLRVCDGCGNIFCPEHGQRGGDRQVQDVGAVAYPALCDKCRSQQ